MKNISTDKILCLTKDVVDRAQIGAAQKLDMWHTNNAHAIFINAGSW